VVILAEKFAISTKIKATNQTEPRSTKPFPSRGGVRGGCGYIGWK